MKSNNIRPCVIGLGYVGLPIFFNLSNKFDTCGYDTNTSRINELKKKNDANLEFQKKEFKFKKKSFFTNKEKDLKNSNFYIITVPTPIKPNKKPELKYISQAINSIRKYLKKNDIVILESTVFPGITENFCGNILKKNKSKLKMNIDFFLGYSPERINPGDKSHTQKKINKVVSYSNKKTFKIINKIYQNLGKKLFFTKKIKEAETAKVIENIQRDVNIALMNELYIFCTKTKLDFSEVIRLASTKWNFLKFKPGLVGGHCLPVDPYYFSEAAKRINQKIRVTLSGRDTNNSMVDFVTSEIAKDIRKQKIKKILIAGLTYKANVPDFRNSLALKIYKKLSLKFKNIFAHDPYIKDKYNKYLKIFKKTNFNSYDKIYFLTNHDSYHKFKKLKNNKYSFLFN